jgi:hypothetical protein
LPKAIAEIREIGGLDSIKQVNKKQPQIAQITRRHIGECYLPQVNKLTVCLLAFVSRRRFSLPLGLGDEALSGTDFRRLESRWSLRDVLSASRQGSIPIGSYFSLS